MNELETFIGPKGRPSQLFNGIVYQLFEGEHYFNDPWLNRLHVAVWTFYNGRPPKGYHIHHIDENKHNNNISNLAIEKGGKHISDHMKKWASEDPEWFLNLARKGQKAASEWSRTPEGYKFRKEHAEKILAPYQEKWMRTKAQKKCDYCGNRFEVILILSEVSRFCSNNCKSAWRRKAGIDNVIKPCRVCGEPFESNKYIKKKCCSRSCGSLLGHHPDKYRED